MNRYTALTTAYTASGRRQLQLVSEFLDSRGENLPEIAGRKAVAACAALTRNGFSSAGLLGKSCAECQCRAVASLTRRISDDVFA